MLILGKENIKLISKWIETKRALHQSDDIAIPLDVDQSNASKKAKTLEKYMLQIEKVLDYNGLKVEIKSKHQKLYCIIIKHSNLKQEVIIKCFDKTPSESDIMNYILENEYTFKQGSRFIFKEVNTN